MWWGSGDALAVRARGGCGLGARLSGQWNCRDKGVPKLQFGHEEDLPKSCEILLAGSICCCLSVKPKLLILLLFVAAAYVAILYQGMRAETASKATQEQLELEFKALPPFPKATDAHPHTGRKSGHGLIDVSYQTDAKLPEVRAYYDSILLARGWRFSNEETFSEGLNGGSIHYTKGRFTASLQYAGERPNYGWDYVFGLSWGL